MRPGRLISVTAASATALLLLAGCSGSDSPEPGASSSAGATGDGGTGESTNPSGTVTDPDGTEADEPIEGDGETTEGEAAFVPGLPDGVEAPEGVSGGVGWAHVASGSLWVVTYGSSTNPQVATAVTVDGQHVSISLGEAVPGADSTADIVPTTSYVELPAEVDTAAPVTVTLGDLGATELASVDAVGWVTVTF